ncbi:MAG: tyrosine-type recombinase/integrase, partial [Magnetococcales bacterium]|nr:tyrosine-type recombinase/integrase [Magnetococcales bacterium]
PTPMLGWIVRLVLQTAMAKEELLRLRKGDLDLAARVVTIPKTLVRPVRQVPLTWEAVRIFRQVLAYPERPPEEELLFFGAVGKGGVRNPLAIDKALRTVLLQARMKGFRFNDLRNEALSRMEEAGLNAAELLTVAGQPLPRTLSPHGARLVRPTMAELVIRLDGAGLGK